MRAGLLRVAVIRPEIAAQADRRGLLRRRHFGGEQRSADHRGCAQQKFAHLCPPHAPGTAGCSTRPTCVAPRASPPTSAPGPGRSAAGTRAQSGPSGLWSCLLNTSNHPGALIAASLKHCGETGHSAFAPPGFRPHSNPAIAASPAAHLGKRRALPPCTPPSATTGRRPARRARAAQRSGPSVAAPGWLAVGNTGDSTTASAPSRRARAMPRRPCAAAINGGAAQRRCRRRSQQERQQPRGGAPIRQVQPGAAAERRAAVARHQQQEPPLPRQNSQAGQDLRSEPARHHRRRAGRQPTRRIPRVRQAHGIAEQEQPRQSAGRPAQPTRGIDEARRPSPHRALPRHAALAAAGTAKLNSDRQHPDSAQRARSQVSSVAR